LLDAIGSEQSRHIRRVYLNREDARPLIRGQARTLGPPADAENAVRVEHHIGGLLGQDKEYEEKG
jgi:hypothetical protein